MSPTETGELSRSELLPPPSEAAAVASLPSLRRATSSSRYCVPTGRESCMSVLVASKVTSPSRDASAMFGATEPGT